MRRIISFFLALALIVAGAAWTMHMWVYAERLYAKVLLAPNFMIIVGCIWIYSDYIDASHNKRP